jgi:hypothetical protein
LQLRADSLDRVESVTLSIIIGVRTLLAIVRSVLSRPFDLIMDAMSACCAVGSAEACSDMRLFFCSIKTLMVTAAISITKPERTPKPPVRRGMVGAR